MGEQDAAGDMDMGHVGSLEPAFDDFVSEMLLMSLASSGRKYGRETRAAHRRIVSEVYSPPRVTAEIKRGRHPHFVPGFAFDLTVNDPDDGQPWGLSVKGKREKAHAKLNKQKPYMLIGSPACTAFSTWMYLNEKKGKDVAATRRAKIRISGTSILSSSSTTTSSLAAGTSCTNTPSVRHRGSCRR